MNPGFEDYLNSKNIDSDAFQRAEPDLWKAWKVEFEQVHPNSFTVQKLNLINAIRRKYQRGGSPGRSPEKPAPKREPE